VSENDEIDQARVTLGQAIREVRERQGQSVSELAAASGLSPRTITRVEAGERETDFDLLNALADGLGVRLSAFVIRAEELEGRREPS
jgi:transcriptional regulator with XRE-family HTH domain